MKADIAADKLLCGSIITDCPEVVKEKEMLEIDYKFVSDYFDHHNINFRTWKHISQDAVLNLTSPGFIKQLDEILHQ